MPRGGIDDERPFHSRHRRNRRNRRKRRQSRNCRQGFRFSRSRSSCDGRLRCRKRRADSFCHQGRLVQLRRFRRQKRRLYPLHTRRLFRKSRYGVRRPCNLLGARRLAARRDRSLCPRQGNPAAGRCSTRLRRHFRARSPRCPRQAGLGGRPGRFCAGKNLCGSKARSVRRLFGRRAAAFVFFDQRPRKNRFGQFPQGHRRLARKNERKSG